MGLLTAIDRSVRRRRTVRLLLRAQEGPEARMERGFAPGKRG